KPWHGDLSKLRDAELVNLHTHKNEWFVNHARRILQERAEGGLDPWAIADLPERCSEKPLRALWTLAATGQWDPKRITRWLEYRDQAVQAWSIRLYLDLQRNNLSQWPKYGPLERLPRPLSSRAALAVLSGLHWWEPAKRVDLLTEVTMEADGRD